MGRGIKSNVLKRVNANRRRATEVQEHDERERAAIRMLTVPVVVEKPKHAKTPKLRIKVGLLNTN